MDHLKKFNKTFNEFIDDIILIFPNDSELRMYKKLISTALTFNSRLIINIFIDSVVLKYGTQLLEKDESFFLNNDYSDLIDSSQTEYNALIQKIKEYWVIMNDENKDIIWKYFRVLILLSKKIVI